MKSDYKAILKVSGMQCSGCADKVKQALKQIEGVHEVTADPEENEAIVMYDGKATVEDFEKVVKSAGYSVEGVMEQE